LPDFLSSAPYGVLIAGVIATRRISDSKRQIIAAEINTFDEKKRIARAKTFIPTCGGIETPRLLLSQSKQFPDEIGNSYGFFDKGFNEHPNINFYEKIPH